MRRRKKKALPAKQEINRKYITLAFATSIWCIFAQDVDTHITTHITKVKPKFFVSGLTYFLLLVVSRSRSLSLSVSATIAGFAFVSQLTIQPASQPVSHSSCTFGVFISNQLVEPSLQFGFYGI